MQGQYHTLREGTTLNQYRIVRILGSGGFGITYLAEDIQLGMQVVIKEYFPNEFAIRKHDSTIIAKTSSAEIYGKGLQRFKEEAKTLAQFNHPSIVKILSYFEANNTAYFVMEYEDGVDLSIHLKQQGHGIVQEEILGMMMPILEGLKEVHRYNYLHRDIKPGNILLRNNKSPVLIDFGASKRAIGEVSKSVTSMLTEGYAPLEQYSTDVAQQGPYTDLYAVGAVIYRMITGKVPPSAQTRSYAVLSGDADPYKPLSAMKLSAYDSGFLKSVDKVLKIKAKERPQSVQEFQNEITGNKVQKEHSRASSKIKRKTEKQKNKNTPLITFLIFLIMLAVGILIYLLVVSEDRTKKNNESVIESQSVPESQKVEKRKSTQIANEEKIRRDRKALEKALAENLRLKKEREAARVAKEAQQRQFEEAERVRRMREEKRQRDARRKADALRNAPRYKVINVRSNDTLNVRANPYVANNKVGELQPYAQGFKVLETQVNYKGDRWSRINYNGLEGWVISRSIAPVGTRTYRKKPVLKKRTRSKPKPVRKTQKSVVWYCEAKSARASGWVRRVGKQNAMNGALEQCTARRQTSSRCRVVNCHPAY